jgi:hypothetical protein
VIESEAEMMAAAFAWADRTLADVSVPESNWWQRWCWKRAMPLTRMTAVAGFVGGYNQAANDAAGAKR